MLGAFKISRIAFEDKPMDLSNYMLLRTKEKMLLEAKLKDYGLVRSHRGVFDKLLGKESKEIALKDAEPMSEYDER